MILGGKFLLLRRLNKFQNNIKTEMATSWRFRIKSGMTHKVRQHERLRSYWITAAVKPQRGMTSDPPSYGCHPGGSATTDRVHALHNLLKLRLMLLHPRQ